MNIVIGTDTDGRYKSTINLVDRLRFPSPKWTLAHSVDVNIPMTGTLLPFQTAYGVEYIKSVNQLAEKSLCDSKEELAGKGFDVDTVILSGSPAGALIEFADENHAELIGVHSERQGALGSLFSGSVSRGLAIGAKQCVLISKGSIESNGPVSVVLATDHSDHANKAIDHFISMGASGISHVHVVFALHLGEGQDSEHRNLISHAPSVIGFLQEHGTKQTSELVAKLTAAGFSCSSEIIDAAPNEAIRLAMATSKADLLVIGAQGHGFMHRLMLGSVALHQVVAEPYSVFLIRP